MTKETVLIISYHSSLNSGDRALLEMNMKQLSLAFDAPKICVSATWPDETYFKQSTYFTTIPSAWRLIIDAHASSPFRQIFHYFVAEIYSQLYVLGKRRWIPPKWLALFGSYDRADVIASVSSTHFYTTGYYGWPFPIKIFMANFAHRVKKPLYIMPQSIGPLRWDWERRLLKSTFGKARKVFLRDQASMNLALTMGLPQEKVCFAPDPAFAYPASDRESAYEVLKKYNFSQSELTLGMTLIPWQGRSVSRVMMQQYYQNVAEFISRFHRKTGARVFLFNQVTGPTPYDDDRNAAKLLIDQLGHDIPWFTYVDEALSPEILKACYGLMGLFLATRLHSGIFALGMSVPVVFVGYGTKTRGMMQWLNLDRWVIDLENVRADELMEKVSSALDSKPAYVESLNRMIPRLKDQVIATSDVIRKDYASIW